MEKKSAEVVRPASCVDCTTCPKRFCIMACEPVNAQLNAIDEVLERSGK